MRWTRLQMLAARIYHVTIDWMTELIPGCIGNSQILPMPHVRASPDERILKL